MSGIKVNAPVVVPNSSKAGFSLVQEVLKRIRKSEAKDTDNTKQENSIKDIVSFLRRTNFSDYALVQTVYTNINELDSVWSGNSNNIYQIISSKSDNCTFSYEQVQKLAQYLPLQLIINDDCSHVSYIDGDTLKMKVFNAMKNYYAAALGIERKVAIDEVLADLENNT